MRGMTSTTWAPPNGKPATHPITVGAIFVNSWGYDQTNVDAYQVVAVTRASVKVRRINQETVPGSEGRDSCRVVPVPDSFSERYPEVLTKRPYSYTWNGRPEWYLHMEHGSCSLYYGGSAYCSWGA